MSKSDGSDLAFPIEPTAAPTYRFKEPWTATLVDNVRSFGIQLVCAGGSGAIAKTAVAPLERVKVSGEILEHMHRCHKMPPARHAHSMCRNLPTAQLHDIAARKRWALSSTKGCTMCITENMMSSTFWETLSRLAAKHGHPPSS